jgi:hypothetical protein
MEDFHTERRFYAEDGALLNWRRRSDWRGSRPMAMTSIFPREQVVNNTSVRSNDGSYTVQTSEVSHWNVLFWSRPAARALAGLPLDPPTLLTLNDTSGHPESRTPLTEVRANVNDLH